MQGVTDRTGRGTLQVMMVVQRSDATRQQKHTGEKSGSHSLSRQTPQARRKRRISDAVPERNPAGYGSLWRCALQTTYMIHDSGQPNGYKRLIVQASDRCQAGRSVAGRSVAALVTCRAKRHQTLAKLSRRPPEIAKHAQFLRSSYSRQDILRQIRLENADPPGAHGGGLPGESLGCLGQCRKHGRSRRADEHAGSNPHLGAGVQIEEQRLASDQYLDTRSAAAARRGFRNSHAGVPCGLGAERTAGGRRCGAPGLSRAM
jgi:hypothetical protein